MATAQQDVQVSVGKDFVIMGEDRVEVSADGKKVTAYASNGVETKAAAGETAATPGISISADFNTVVLNGVTIERAADGHLVISAPGGTVLVQQQAPANDSKKTLEIGDVKDGWAYVGMDKGQNVFAKACDVQDGKSSLTKQWQEVMDFAASQNAHLGSDEELDLLQKNIINKGLLKGDFDTTGSTPAGWVWGSRRHPSHPDVGARVQRLSGGLRGWVWQDNACSVVLFRSEPRP